MRRLSLLLAVVFVLMLLGSDSPKEYDGEMTAGGIDGTWLMTEYEFQGRKEKVNASIVHTYRKRTFAIVPREGETWKGTFRTDLKPPSASP